jgi:DNA-binding MltR family transcriptional regulator
MKVPKLRRRKLAKTAEDVELRRLEFIEALATESDRGCVLVAGAVLDEALELFLRAQMPQDKQSVDSVVDPLFKHPGPLASFWSRIRIAYALGYISPATFHDLELVREIRNKFAHDYVSATFSNPEVKTLLDDFKGADAGLEYARSSVERARAIQQAAAMAPPRAAIAPTMERVRWAVGIGWIVVALETATQKYVEAPAHMKVPLIVV